MYVWFHHVDRVKRQFGSEQAVPLDPVNLDGFDRASARGDDKWWPTELAYWYGFWHNRRRPEHQIQIVATHYPGWPTQEYAAWWAVACRRRFLSPDQLLHDPRGQQLPDDVPAMATQAREQIVLPHDAPAHERRARMQRPDIRRKGEGTRVETMVTRRRSRIRGDGDAPCEPDLNFISGADIEPARFILQGKGSGAGIAPHASGAGTSFNEMYDVFSCGEQTMDHITHEYRASRATEDAVYRPGPPLQPHHDPDEQRQGFQYYQPSQQSYIQPSPQQQYQLPSPHC
ncbi:hypothetical protein PIB30_068549 [Stylosanthes scabra]|uniref:Aminotransferase-like plant mobile domain-containing protein n=1 Tax=Stylosanthes scabra TaxID=79078 RepID=A0ABU6YN99_9FABA|nr:hypothetical protein [Stylosanthes scabra]